MSGYPPNLVDLYDRVVTMFDIVTLRVYTAAIVGAFRQRSPFGPHRSVLLPANTPQRIAFNDSKMRALLVYANARSLINGPVLYSSSDSVGSVNFAVPRSQPLNAAQVQFVLKPSEMLFAMATPTAATVTVSEEWY